MSLAELGLFTVFSDLVGAFTALTWVTFTTGFLGAALRVRLLRGAVAATVIESDLLGTLLLYTKNAPNGAFSGQFVNWFRNR